MKLTENFDLNEFLASNTATRLGFQEQFQPPDEVVDNLKALCEHILQPLRGKLDLGYIRISSGYRCERLNTAVKGQPNSQHLLGQAADIEWVVNGTTDNKALFMYIQKTDLDFDQLINEFNYAWVHISYDPNKAKQRHQVLSIG